MSRGRPFEPGNTYGKGRPEGSRNKATLELESLLEKSGEAILSKAVVSALQGDAVALRLCVERLVPVRRHRPIVFDLPPIHTAADVVLASDQASEALSRGELTSAELKVITDLIELRRRSIETVSLEQRVRALEQKTVETGQPESATQLVEAQKGVTQIQEGQRE